MDRRSLWGRQLLFCVGAKGRRIEVSIWVNHAVIDQNRARRKSQVMGLGPHRDRSGEGDTSASCGQFIRCWHH